MRSVRRAKHIHAIRAQPLRLIARSTLFASSFWQSARVEMDTLGIEPRASRMLSRCDTTTPLARLKNIVIVEVYLVIRSVGEWGRGAQNTVF